MSLAGLKIDAEQLAKLPPKEREVVAEELRALEDAFKANPLMAYNHPVLSKPHPKQREFHSPPFPRTRLFLGGNRSGKTTASMVDTIIQCVDPDQVPEHLKEYKRWQPPFYCRVVIPDLTRSLEGVTLQKFREWCPKGQLHGGGMDRAWDKQQLMLRFKNGSWVQFMSNDQDLDKFGGAALHRVVYDEEPRQDIRRECLMRLIDYGGEELYGMTPLHGMSWVYDDFFEPWENGEQHDDVRIVVVDMDDNPHLDDDTKEWVLQGLSMEERQARKSGRFVAFAGLIYPEFSVGTHVIPAIERLPPGVEVFRGVDPGYRHMCAVGYYYLDADDELVKFDELSMQGSTVKEVCDEMRRRDMRWGFQRDDGTILPLNASWTVIDPAAKNKNNQTGRSDQQEFFDNGVATIPGQNAVAPGINRVKERLRAGKYKVCANCVVTIGQYKKYRWQKDSARTENAPAERPAKVDDHHCDTDRYVIMQRPLAPTRDRPKPSETMKDRLLRESLKALRRGGNRRGPPADHFAGSGIFQ